MKRSFCFVQKQQCVFWRLGICIFMYTYRERQCCVYIKKKRRKRKEENKREKANKGASWGGLEVWCSWIFFVENLKNFKDSKLPKLTEKSIKNFLDSPTNFDHTTYILVHTLMLLLYLVFIFSSFKSTYGHQHTHNSLELFFFSLRFCLKEWLIDY